MKKMEKLIDRLAGNLRIGRTLEVARKNRVIRAHNFIGRPGWGWALWDHQQRSSTSALKVAGSARRVARAFLEVVGVDDAIKSVRVAERRPEKIG